MRGGNRQSPWLQPYLKPRSTVLYTFHFTHMHMHTHTHRVPISLYAGRPHQAAQRGNESVALCNNKQKVLNKQQVPFCPSAPSSSLRKGPTWISRCPDGFSGGDHSKVSSVRKLTNFSRASRQGWKRTFCVLGLLDCHLQGSNSPVTERG